MKYLLICAVLLSGLSSAVAQNSPVGATKSQKAPPAPAASAPDSRWAPGWVVDVMPQPLKGQPAEVAGRFIAKPEGFAFGDFRKTMPLPGWVSFKAHGTFDAKHDDPKSQRYAFTLIILSATEATTGFSMVCQQSITLDGIDIVPFESTKRRWDGRGKFEISVSGGSNLDQNSHDINFSVSCEPGNGYDQPDPDRFFHNYPSVKDVFDKIRVEFRVLTPNDLAPRVPAANELVHPVKTTRR
ncbi:MULTISPECIES: hypothetical protein [Methylobacteriaceae]|uniref:hypothetical protein n=1 Tax=Methylobacteriaceae TaxID=119045 RepID=UPI002F35212D